MPRMITQLITSKRQSRYFDPGVLVFRRIIAILMASLCSGLWHSTTQPVRAQVPNTLLVQPPDLEGFPTPSVQFKLLTSSEKTKTVLQATQLTVFENEREVPVLSLAQEHHGVHFTLALNGGRELDLSDANGLSPYDRLRDVLVDWADSRSFAGNDAWSLVTSEGVEVRNTAVPEVWTDALGAYQPNFRTMEPTLASLESAIHLASERVVPFGIDKAVLYITPPPTPGQIGPLNALAEEARSAGIFVNVWMVGDAHYLVNDQGGALIAMAAATRGQFFHYTGEGAIPDPEDYLAPLGSIYTLTYQSSIHETGTYPLRIQAALPEGNLSGESVPFYLDIQPPNPILISPPASITRQVTGPQEVLSPGNFVVNIMIEFPDGHPREIAASRLYIDERVVDVRTEAPFDSLVWDLVSLTESGEHSIQVEVDDSLGLSARTILTPVQIEVVQPVSEPHLSWQQIGFILAGVIFTAAIALLLVWLSPRLKGTSTFKRFKEHLITSRKDSAVERLPVLLDVETIHATLIPLNGHALDWENEAIQITQPKVLFGNDPNLADQVLGGKDVDGLQAQLNLRDDSFWLEDLGSKNGTWVNYAPIGTEPVQVYPGDLIHFGNSGFRFTIINSQTPLKLTITNYEPMI